MKLKSLSKKDRYGNMFSVEFDTSVPEMSLIPNHPGEPKGTDTVPAWLTPGEFVMNAESVRMFEPQIEAMNDAGRAVQKQQGGTIPQYKSEGGLLDRLVNMFSSDDEVPRLPDATMGAVPPAVDARAGRVDELSKAMFPQGATRPDPKVSNEILMNLLKDKEGFRDKAYLDSAGIPTIGYGFTEGVQMGDTMDENIANKRLLQEMARTDEDYNKLVTVDLNPNQEAAVKSLLYNIGGPQFANSKARAALNAGDFDTFKKEASEFRMADGKVVPGLENRRRDELELFFKPYKPDRPETKDSVTATIPGEDQDAFQRKVEEAQRITREKGIYDPDGDMAQIQAGIDEAKILEDQRRMQQGQVPSLGAPPKSNEFQQANEFAGLGSSTPPPEQDDRGALQKFGESGGLMGALSRGTDTLNKIKEKFQNENIQQNRTNRLLLEQDRMQQGQIKEPPKVSAFDQDFSDVEDMSPAGSWTATQEQQQAAVDVMDTGNALNAARDNIKALETKIKKANESGKAADDSDIDKLNQLKKELPDLEKENQTALANQVSKNQKAAGLEDEDLDQDAEQDLAYTIAGQTPPPTGAPPKDDPSPFAKGGEDTPVTDLTTVEKIADDKNFPDDGTTKGQTETSATSEGKKPENKDDVKTATSFFKDIFGDLYDSGELKRMAIMYVGSRALGGSHNGSLNFAAKAYVKRVDAKVDAHNKYVKDLYKGGKHTSKSLDKFRKSKNLADLELKGATYSPTGGTPITKMMPIYKDGEIAGYSKQTLVPVKSSADGGTYYQTTGGTVIHPAKFASMRDYREELDPRSGEPYQKRRARIEGEMETFFSEIRENAGNYFTNDDNQKQYYVEVGPKEAASAFFAWAEKQGSDPDSPSARRVMKTAYENMIADAKNPDKKFSPRNFTEYLEDQQLRETTGAPELFITNSSDVAEGAAPKFVTPDKMNTLYENLDVVVQKIPGSTTRRDDIIGIAIRKWNAMQADDPIKKKYESSAIGSKGETGFYKYMMDTAEALHAELNKPKE